MGFTPQEIARACRSWGSMLWLSPQQPGIDGVKLLWALSGCESSFGKDVTPRYEPAYDAGGELVDAVQQKLLEEYGKQAAASYGPWQIMLRNCHLGTSPEDMANLNRATMETVGFINRHILTREGAKTIAEIAEAWNSGKWQWTKVPEGVERYAAECEKYYATEAMPAAV